MSRSFFSCRVKRIVSLVIIVFFSCTVAQPSLAGEVTVDELLGKEAADMNAPTKPVKQPKKSKLDTLMTTESVASASMGSEGSSTQSSINHFQFDPTNGAGVIALPIAAPPGRRGLKPNITLSYSPRAGNGPYGMGWNISFGMIERSAKNGVPTYNDEEDTFIAVIDGMSMELVKIADGRYRAKAERAFYDFQYDGQYWTVKNGKGLTYYFGRDDLYQDQSRRLYGGTAPPRWHLSKVMDTSGNYYIIRTLLDGEFEIYWSGEPGTDEDGVNTSSQNFFARVTVVSEPRNDRIASERMAVHEGISHRIKEIHVDAKDQLQRKYVFQYDYSQRSDRSLLKSIAEYGADEATAMPEIIFEYEEDPVAYSLVGVEGDPIAGDDLWAFRYNGGFDFGGSGKGPLPPYAMLPLSETIRQQSWSGLGSWTQDDYGRIELWGVQDTAYYFYTYLYVQEPTTLTFAYQANDWTPYMALNGQQLSTPEWNLKAGYNLMEYTDYNQNQSFHAKFLNTIADKVDLMNSVQLILPQMSGDFNGDGLMDVATYFPVYGKIKVALSNGAAFLPKETWLDSIDEDSRVVIGDVNADGKTDVMVVDPQNGDWEAALSDGTQFVRDGQWLSAFGAGEQVMAGEINGDGYVDVLRVFDEDGKKKVQAAMNRKGYFEVDPAILVAWDTTTAQIFMSDFNGDGLSDLGAFEPSTGMWRIVGNKRGTPDSLDMEGNDYLTFTFGAGQQMVAADFNGDGITDAGSFDSATGQITYRASWSSWMDPDVSTLPFTFNLREEGLQLQNGDFNGDGVMDFIVYNALGNIEFAYSDGKISDVLTEVDNGIGGITTIEYQPSSAFPNIYLPFVIPMVSAVTVSNSRDYAVRTRYDYEGGMWDPEDREFYGFQKVRVYDADDNYQETEFYQDDLALRGHPKSSRFVSSDGTVLNQTLQDWQVETLTDVSPEITFAYLKRTDQFEYDREGGVRRTASEYVYGQSPQFGHPTQVINYGEVAVSNGNDIGNDKRSVQTQYVNNTAEHIWLIGLPAVADHYAYGMATPYLTESFGYDDGAVMDAPIKGLRTTSALKQYEPNLQEITQHFLYDAYGNVVQTTDFNGNPSWVDYDAEFHAFPVARRNALDQQAVQQYYGVDGVSMGDFSAGQYGGLFGQKKSATDINNVSEYYVYDVLGRLKLAHGPHDTLALPTVQNTYDHFDNYTRVVTEKRLEHGTTRTVKSVVFLDGLGKTIQTKSPSGQDGVFIISGESDVDNRGLVFKKYNPRSTTLAQEVLEDAIPMGWPHALYDYDELGRPLSVINPDGTFTTQEYYVGKTVGIDANGHKQAAYADVFGNVIRREEFSGADGRDAHYPSAPYQLYATTQYEYDYENRLISTQDAHDNFTNIMYDGFGRKIAMDDPDMGYWQYGYDDNGNLIWQVDANGNRLDFAYDTLNRLVNKTNYADIDVTYNYDLNPGMHGVGRLGSVEYGPMIGDDNTQFFYDDVGRETQSLKVIDGIGYYVERGYDAMDNLNEVVYPDGNSVFYHYDNAGRLDAIANDPVMFQGEPLSKIDADDGVWGRIRHFYSDWVEPYVLGITAAHAMAYVPPSPRSIISPADGDTISETPFTFVFDAGSQVSWTYLYIGTSPGNEDIFFANVTGLASIDISSIPLNGDPLYVRLESWMNSGAIYSYDYVFQTVDLSAPANQPPVVTAGIDQEITLPDTADLNAAASDDDLPNPPGSLTLQWSKVSGPGTVNFSSPNSASTTASFSSEGTYVLKLNAYDGLLNGSDEVTVTVNPAPSSNQPPVMDLTDQNIESDQLMQMDFTVTDADQDVMSFDAGMTSLPQGCALETVSSTSGELQARLTWEPSRADLGDHEIMLAVSDGQETVTDQIMIHVARGVIVEDPKLYVSDIEYNVMGQTSTITYGTGTVKQYFYNELNFRLERITTINNHGIAIQDLSYQYDAVGNIVSVTDAVNTASQTFQYDHLNRLVAASDPATYGTKTYQYDEIGNILTKDGKSYAYGQHGSDPGRTLAKPHAVTSLSDGSSFGYDDNGNMVTHNSSRGNFSYNFDAENRLASVEKDNNTSVAFRYDGDGGRTKKVAYGAVSGIPIGSMAYPELLQDGAGANDLVTHFIGELYEVDNLHEVKHVYMGSERIVSVHDGIEQYIHGDHLGSSNVVEDNFGDLVQVNEYQPFGEFSRRDAYSGEGQESDLYFTQQILDDETGLYYYGARYYDPMLGRFISADPTVQHPNDPQDLNRYAYVRNNPINLTDPTGYDWWSELRDSVGGFLDDSVDWLEKATGAEWSVDVQVSTSQPYQDFQTVGQITGDVGYAMVTQPWQAGIGIFRWAFLDSRYRILETTYDPWKDGVFKSYINDGDSVFVNGILNSEEYAIQNANKVHATKVAYNPTDGVLADLVESFLQKVTFTSAFDRQLSRDLSGHKGITLSGHSQGGIIIGNTLLNLGLRNQRSVVKKSIFINTQISTPRAYLSSVVGGVNAQHVAYRSRYFDFSNALAPNITEPLKFLSGVGGLLYLPLGLGHHGIQ